MKKLRLLAASLFLTISFISFAPNLQAEDIFQQSCDSEGSTSPQAKSTTCQQVDEQTASGVNPVSGPEGIIQDATNIFAIVAGVAGLIMLFYGGFVFATAGGARAGDNSARAREARTVVVSAITGMIIVALAWTIITYINTRIIH